MAGHWQAKSIIEYYIAPVENVRIVLRVPEGKTVAGVESLAGGAFRKQSLGDSLEIVLPRMEAYQGVAVRFR